jgi:hypothetical protein
VSTSEVSPPRTGYTQAGADVAQSVEHQLPKLRVAGSIPAVRFNKSPGSGAFLLLMRANACAEGAGTAPAPSRIDGYLVAAASAFTSPEPKKLLLPMPPEQT